MSSLPASLPAISRPHSVWHRTRLPHFEAGEHPQHITFRLHDSLPRPLLEQWRAELSHLSEAEQQTERRRRIEAALDAGHGACWLRQPQIAGMVQGALQHFDGQRYRLHEWVVMPNHVHVLITPLYGNSLSSILHSWKSFTAKQANDLIGQEGAFWQEDYFDRAIREERHWARAVEYIRLNPVKAGLVAHADDFRWSSAWEGERLALPDTRAGRPRSQGLANGGVGAAAYADAVGVYLGLGIDKATDYNSSLVLWSPTRDQTKTTFSRQALPMAWDFAETNVFANAAGDVAVSLEGISRTLERFGSGSDGHVLACDSQNQSISLHKLVSTDPPYYDNIGYADLSDFFYVWLRRTLKPVFPDLFATLAVPKAEELVATPYRHGSKVKAEAFFLGGMTEAMHRLAEQAHPAFPVTIYYAFKQSENLGARASRPRSNTEDGTSSLPGVASTGWDTFLAAVIEAGFAISGTWPIRTERQSRSIGIGTNALASSIVLVCRKRADDAPTATRREFVTVLKSELPIALAHLQRGNIAPVDLAQAAIGPGMAIYTRYARVLDAEGKSLTVREALSLINQTLDEALAEQEGDFDADSRWAVAWFEQSGFAEGDYGVAETLSKAKNTSIQGMVHDGILTAKGGKVRLLRPDELPGSAGVSPALEKKISGQDAHAPRLTAWEMVHQLIRALEAGGEGLAASLVARLGAEAEVARELAYRLYTLCERKKRAAEALSYNALVQSWPEITRLTREGDKSSPVSTGQTEDMEL